MLLRGEFHSACNTRKVKSIISDIAAIARTVQLTLCSVFIMRSLPGTLFSQTAKFGDERTNKQNYKTKQTNKQKPHTVLVEFVLMTRFSADVGGLCLAVHHSDIIACVCVCVCACVRACVRACVCVHVYVHVCVLKSEWEREDA